MDFRTLPKDCSCVIHEGPHWLHIDLLAFERNLKLLQPLRSQFGWLAFAKEESIRIHEKLQVMERYVKDENEPCQFPVGYSEHEYTARTKAVLLAQIEKEQPQ